MKLTLIKPSKIWQALLLAFVISLFAQCKKTDAGITPDSKQLYAEKFFEKPATSSAEVQAIIDLLKKENEQSGFINTLPENAGFPVWGKLIVEKPKPKPGFAARGIIADKDGNILIPLSNDNKTLSALLLAMQKDGKYEFYCYDNNYAYGVAFSIDKYTIKQREMVMGLFMGISNYVFGTNKFKSIPKDLFPGYVSNEEENGTTKKVNLMLAPGTLPDIFISGVISSTPEKCYWEFTGKCNCSGSNNTPQNCKHPNSECPVSYCTKQMCYSLIFDNGTGPGTDPPPDNPNGGTGTSTATSTSSWSNGIDGGSTLPDPSNGNLPNAPCSNNCAWYPEAAAYEFELEPTPLPQCNLTCEEAQEVLNAVTGVEAQDELKIIYGNENVDASGKIRRSLVAKLGLVTLNFHWGANPPHYSAFFQGVAYKNNPSDTWKWESCAYINTQLDDGTLPICFGVTHNVNVSPIVISADKRDASAFITFLFYGKFTCLGSLTDPQLIYSGGDRTYHIPIGN